MKRWLADLIRAQDALSALPPGQARAELHTHAALLGLRYEPKEPPPSRAPLAPAPPHPDPLPDFDPAPQTGPIPPTPLWRMQGLTPAKPTKGKKELSTQGMTAKDLHDPSRSLFRHPPVTPINTWARLAPRLRVALARHRPSRALDSRALVRTLSLGEPVPERLPTLEQRHWPSELHLWVDRSHHLLTTFRDQERLIRRLRCVLGARLILHGMNNTYQLPELPRACAVLVLGDLGVGGSPGAPQRWQACGQALRRRGVAAFALCPTTPLGRTRHATDCSPWTLVPWQERAPRPSPKERERLRRRLLRLCSMGGLVQPGLLRDLRLLLPGAGAQVEVDALADPAVRAYGATGLVLTDSARRELNEEFIRCERPLHAQVAEQIQRWHQGMPAELLHCETLRWHLQVTAPPGPAGAPGPEQDPAPQDGAPEDPAAAHDAPPAQAPGDLAQATAFYNRVRATLQSRPSPDLARAMRLVTQYLPESAYDQETELGGLVAEIWARAHQALDAVSAPEGLDPSVLQRIQDPKDQPLQEWELRQVGGELCFLPPAEQRDPAQRPPRPGSPLGWIWATDWVMVGRERRTLHLELRLPMPAGGAAERSLSIVTQAATYHLTLNAPAEVCARDRHGLYKHAPETGPMRWVPPGRFLMGSPSDESERDSDETQHPVTLTRGLWLGQTPVTQAQWRSVMAKSGGPSHFKGESRPVESISWYQALRFCVRLSQATDSPIAYWSDRALTQPFKGEGAVWWDRGADAFRLPTEAEWERACRAGTSGPRWREPLSEIAWFNDNSGGETHAVGQLVSNPWGLHDMLGNVWEWCADALAPYPTAPRKDPLSAAGTERVLRGGSWGASPRSARAAYRNWYHPGGRNHYLGFRLAQGPAAGGPVLLSEQAAARDEPEQAQRGAEGR